MRGLEIGGGQYPTKPKWYEQFDMHPWKELEGYAALHIGDARDLSRFDDRTFDTVFASQVLEHFSWRESPAVLTEWWRLVKVGGTLELGLPDIVGIAKDYLNGLNDFDLFIERVYGTQDYEGNTHYTMFTIEEFIPWAMKVLDGRSEGVSCFKTEYYEPIAKGGGFHVILRKNY